MVGIKLGIGAAVLVITGATALGAILGIEKRELAFKTPDVGQKARWTKSQHLKLTPAGLLHDAPGPQSLDFSLQTESLAVGLSWRPARAVSIRATLTPIATTVKLASGDSWTPQVGRLYARYSPDAKHWSSWHVLASTTDASGYKFSGELAVPQQAQTEYNELVGKYAQQPNIPWASDEEAAVKWIIAQKPDFFVQRQPFIGYVQFLYEAQLSGGQRIDKLAVDVSYGVGGLHAVPKDPKTADKRDIPWRWRAP
jgi:hypothetical protein